MSQTTESLMARTQEVRTETVPIERIKLQPARDILQKLGISSVYAYWGYDGKGTTTLVSFDGFPWGIAELDLSDAEGIVRCLSRNGCGLPFSARITEGGYQLDIVPPSVYRRDLEKVLPKLPEAIKGRIDSALQNQLGYKRSFTGTI